jgi:hypothetical protein
VLAGSKPSACKWASSLEVELVQQQGFTTRCQDQYIALMPAGATGQLDPILKGLDRLHQCSIGQYDAEFGGSPVKRSTQCLPPNAPTDALGERPPSRTTIIIPIPNPCKLRTIFWPQISCHTKSL